MLGSSGPYEGHLWGSFGGYLVVIWGYLVELPGSLLGILFMYLGESVGVPPPLSFGSHVIEEITFTVSVSEPLALN